MKTAATESLKKEEEEEVEWKAEVKEAPDNIGQNGGQQTTLEIQSHIGH